MERFFSNSALARETPWNGRKKYERMPLRVDRLRSRMPKWKFLSTHGGEPMSSKPQFQLAASLPVVSEALCPGYLESITYVWCDYRCRLGNSIGSVFFGFPRD